MRNDKERGKHVGRTAHGEELVRTDWQQYDQPARGIIEAIAGVKDTRPTELPPLGGELDVEAVNKLLSTTKEDSNLVISFEYEGLTVTAEQSGTLIVAAIS
jgi:hypothetical protein